MLRILGKCQRRRPACQLQKSPMPKLHLLNSYCFTDVPALVPHIQSFNIIDRHYSENLSRNPPSKLAVNIYRGGLSMKFDLMKLLALCTSFSGITNFPIIYSQIEKLGGTITTTCLCSLSAVILFAIPLGIHLFANKYVVDIRYNPETDEYTATKINLILLKNHITFKVKDIEVPDIQGKFKMILVGREKVPLLVHMKDFAHLQHYNRFVYRDTTKMNRESNAE